MTATSATTGSRRAPSRQTASRPLALTYTLFGISLGIGSLAGQGLTPETVESVIRNLTASFSLAFMTTVIGLPLSALLRAALVVVHGRRCLAIRDAGSSLERRKP